MEVGLFSCSPIYTLDFAFVHPFSNTPSLSDKPAACFHLGTGDVEDAPALDALAKYEVFEKGGAVYIRGDEASIKASRRQPGLACQAQGQEEIVVLGG